jgi:hypothetical protein
MGSRLNPEQPSTGGVQKGSGVHKNKGGGSVSAGGRVRSSAPPKGGGRKGSSRAMGKAGRGGKQAMDVDGQDQERGGNRHVEGGNEGDEQMLSPDDDTGSGDETEHPKQQAPVDIEGAPQGSQDDDDVDQVAAFTAGNANKVRAGRVNWVADMVKAAFKALPTLAADVKNPANLTEKKQNFKASFQKSVADVLATLPEFKEVQMTAAKANTWLMHFRRMTEMREPRDVRAEMQGMVRHWGSVAAQEALDWMDNGGRENFHQLLSDMVSRDKANAAEEGDD